MDAVIKADAIEMSLVAVDATVVTVIVVEDLVQKLQSLFDPACVLVSLSLNGSSISAVAPDYISRGGVSALASA